MLLNWGINDTLYYYMALFIDKADATKVEDECVEAVRPSSWSN